MEVKKVRVADIKPYPNNPRRNDEAVAAVAESIRQCGYCAPIVVDENMVILAGHTRHRALEQLGWVDCEVVVKDGLTDEMKRKYRLLDNKTAEISGWDFERLEEELEGLDFEGFDFGFDMVAIGKGTPQVEEDDFDVEPPEEPKAKPGDIYQLGHHRLICGDSTDVAVINRLMDGVKADMVFTDPPYGYNYQSNMRTKSEKFDVLENDDKILNFFQSIKNTVVGFVYVCTTWKTADKWIELFKQYYELTNVIIWDKGGGGIGDLFHTFSTDYEMILVCNNGQELRGKRYGSVWNFTDTEISKMKKEELLKIVLEQKEYYSIWKQKKDNPNEYVHPTQKPVALSARAIRSSTDFDGIVLDVFGGSGSTLIACEQLNRKCYMCELDPRYVDVIIARWENLTDKKAVLLNG